MKTIRIAAAVVAAAAMSSAVLARDTAPRRYRVAEVATPAGFTGADACLQGYARNVHVVSMNDSGVVAANFRCLTAVDPNFLNFNFRAFVSAPAFGGYELSQGAETAGTYAINIDSRATAYGETFGNAGPALWRLGTGGAEQAFQPYDCGGWTGISIAYSGNGHGYVVGFTLRTDPALAPPLDTICLALGWAIRTPSGATVYGPVNGSPSDVNAHDVAVGQVGNSAIRLDLPSNTQFVLNPGDDHHSVIASDINDRGQAVGYIDELPNGTYSQCGPSAPRFWERNGHERALQPLAGDVSGRAWAAGYADDAVGESGPGAYCEAGSQYNQSAVLWRGTRAYDLNDLIPRGENITLVYAADINRHGQIAAAGYRNDDPLLPCPGYRTDPVMGYVIIDMTLLCRELRGYVLTPR
jgi:hypothetical protein